MLLLFMELAVPTWVFSELSLRRCTYTMQMLVDSKGLFVHSKVYLSFKSWEFERGTNEIFGVGCPLQKHLQKLIHSTVNFMRICFLRSMDSCMAIEFL